MKAATASPSSASVRSDPSVPPDSVLDLSSLKDDHKRKEVFSVVRALALVSLVAFALIAMRLQPLEAKEDSGLATAVFGLG